MSFEEDEVDEVWTLENAKIIFFILSIDSLFLFLPTGLPHHHTVTFFSQNLK